MLGCVFVDGFGERLWQQHGLAIICRHVALQHGQQHPLHRVSRAPGPHINGLLTRLAFQCDMGCFDSVLCNRRLVEFWERCEAAPCVVL